MRTATLTLTLALPCCLLAQTLVTDFPPTATTLAPEALRERLEGQVFSIKTAALPAYRLEFRKSYAYINSGRGDDSGAWRIEGSQLCIDWRRFNAGCSEVRLAEGVLYFKRTANNEVVAMTPY